MTDNPKSDDAQGSNRDKKPEDWVTGDETRPVHKHRI